MMKQANIVDSRMTEMFSARLRSQRAHAMARDQDRIDRSELCVDQERPDRRLCDGNQPCGPSRKRLHSMGLPLRQARILT